MDAGRLIAALERFADALPAAATGVSSEDSRWKPDDGAWSILEIVRHLVDEESLDFRTRLRLTLEGAPDWPAIDPEGWAVERRYNEGDLGDAVDSFVHERRASIQWLKSLRDADWSVAHRHPSFGDIHAGQLLGAWPAHDALHLRQIAKRLWQLAGRDAAPFPVQYAGEWRA
jgi:hypothetical protein